MVSGSPAARGTTRGATGTSGATRTPSYRGARIIFLDTEMSNWAWDPVSKSYYWHRFFSHQPDLNYDNPAVREEMWNVMKFWLEIGVDGFRLDAVPYLVEREGTLLRKSARNPCRDPGIAASPRRKISRAGCCWQKPTNGRRTCVLISATATNSTWRFTFR